MSHAIRIHAYGGPEVMQWEPHDPGEPGRGEALIRQTAVGLNFIDVYERTGLYPVRCRSGLGREAAGVVEARRSRGPWARGRRPRRLRLVAGRFLRASAAAWRPTAW